jgi:hypothetical protein
MCWIARKGRVYAFDYRWLWATKSGAMTLSGMVTLAMTVLLTVGCATQPKALPTAPLPPVSEAQVNEVVAMVRFANNMRDLPTAERKALTQNWERRLADGSSPKDARLYLALLLLAKGGTKPGDAARARELLTAYLADEKSQSQALREFARFQLGWLDEKERWIKAARRERKARVGLEKKLEALKAIELRMTDQNSKDRVPIR